MSTRVTSGIVTLTTDYGLRDPFVGIITGQILARCPGARVVSLTHSITPFAPDEAGFWLARSWREFPVGTVHLAVVDPGVGTQRDLIALGAAGHVFLAPDNGLLDRVRHGVRVEHCHRMDLERLAALGIRPRSFTFHGRDLFAPVAGELASGRLAAADLGPATLLDALQQPERVPGEGVVVVVDHFGNLITDLEQGEIDALGAARVFLGPRELTFHRTYGDVPPGDALALVNSFGLVEIAINGASAALALGAGRGTRVRLAASPNRS
jgi:hypothetical protein